MSKIEIPDIAKVNISGRLSFLKPIDTPDALKGGATYGQGMTTRSVETVQRPGTPVRIENPVGNSTKLRKSPELTTVHETVETIRSRVTILEQRVHLLNAQIEELQQKLAASAHLEQAPTASMQSKITALEQLQQATLQLAQEMGAQILEIYRIILLENKQPLVQPQTSPDNTLLILQIQKLIVQISTLIEELRQIKLTSQQLQTTPAPTQKTPAPKTGSHTHTAPSTDPISPKLGTPVLMDESFEHMGREYQKGPYFDADPDQKSKLSIVKTAEAERQLSVEMQHIRVFILQDDVKNILHFQPNEAPEVYERRAVLAVLKRLRSLGNFRGKNDPLFELMQLNTALFPKGQDNAEQARHVQAAYALWYKIAALENQVHIDAYLRAHQVVAKNEAFPTGEYTLGGNADIVNNGKQTEYAIKDLLAQSLFVDYVRHKLIYKKRPDGTFVTFQERFEELDKKRRVIETDPNTNKQGIKLSKIHEVTKEIRKEQAEFYKAIQNALQHREDSVPPATATIFEQKVFGLIQELKAKPNDRLQTLLDAYFAVPGRSSIKPDVRVGMQKALGESADASSFFMYVHKGVDFMRRKTELVAGPAPHMHIIPEYIAAQKLHETPGYLRIPEPFIDVMVDPRRAQKKGTSAVPTAPVTGGGGGSEPLGPAPVDFEVDPLSPAPTAIKKPGTGIAPTAPVGPLETLPPQTEFTAALVGLEDAAIIEQNSIAGIYRGWQQEKQLSGIRGGVTKMLNKVPRGGNQIGQMTYAFLHPLETGWMGRIWTESSQNRDDEFAREFMITVKNKDLARTHIEIPPKKVVEALEKGKKETQKNAWTRLKASSYDLFANTFALKTSVQRETLKWIRAETDETKEFKKSLIGTETARFSLDKSAQLAESVSKGRHMISKERGETYEEASLTPDQKKQFNSAIIALIKKYRGENVSDEQFVGELNRYFSSDGFLNMFPTEKKKEMNQPETAHNILLIARKVKADWGRYNTQDSREGDTKGKTFIDLLTFKLVIGKAQWHETQEQLVSNEKTAWYRRWKLKNQRAILAELIRQRGDENATSNKIKAPISYESLKDIAMNPLTHFTIAQAVVAAGHGALSSLPDLLKWAVPVVAAPVVTALSTTVNEAGRFKKERRQISQEYARGILARDDQRMRKDLEQTLVKAWRYEELRDSVTAYFDMDTLTPIENITALKPASNSESEKKKLLVHLAHIQARMQLSALTATHDEVQQNLIIYSDDVVKSSIQTGMPLDRRLRFLVHQAIEKLGGVDAKIGDQTIGMLLAQYTDITMAQLVEGAAVQDKLQKSLKALHKQYAVGDTTISDDRITDFLEVAGTLPGYETIVSQADSLQTAYGKYRRARNLSMFLSGIFGGLAGTAVRNATSLLSYVPGVNTVIATANSLNPTYAISGEISRISHGGLAEWQQEWAAVLSGKAPSAPLSPLQHAVLSIQSPLRALSGHENSLLPIIPNTVDVKTSEALGNTAISVPEDSPYRLISQADGKVHLIKYEVNNHNATVSTDVGWFDNDGNVHDKSTGALIPEFTHHETRPEQTIFKNDIPNPNTTNNGDWTPSVIRVGDKTIDVHIPHGTTLVLDGNGTTYHLVGNTNNITIARDITYSNGTLSGKDFFGKQITIESATHDVVTPITPSSGSSTSTESTAEPDFFKQWGQVINRKWHDFNNPGKTVTDQKDLEMYVSRDKVTDSSGKQHDYVTFDVNGMKDRYEVGPNGEHINVQDAIANHQTAFAFTHPTYGSVLVRDDSDGVWDGKLKIDLNDTDPAHTVTLLNHNGTVAGTMSVHDFAQSVIDKNKLDVMWDSSQDHGTLSTDWLTMMSKQPLVTQIMKEHNLTFDQALKVLNDPNSDEYENHHAEYDDKYKHWGSIYKVQHVEAGVIHNGTFHAVGTVSNDEFGKESAPPPSVSTKTVTDYYVKVPDIWRIPSSELNVPPSVLNATPLGLEEGIFTARMNMELGNVQGTGEASPRRSGPKKERLPPNSEELIPIISIIQGEDNRSEITLSDEPERKKSFHQFAENKKKKKPAVTKEELVEAFIEAQVDESVRSNNAINQEVIRQEQIQKGVTLSEKIDLYKQSQNKARIGQRIDSEERIKQIKVLEEAKSKAFQELKEIERTYVLPTILGVTEESLEAKMSDDSSFAKVVEAFVHTVVSYSFEQTAQLEGDLKNFLSQILEAVGRGKDSLLIESYLNERERLSTQPLVCTGAGKWVAANPESTDEIRSRVTEQVKAQVKQVLEQKRPELLVLAGAETLQTTEPVVVVPPTKSGSGWRDKLRAAIEKVRQKKPPAVPEVPTGEDDDEEKEELLSSFETKYTFGDDLYDQSHSLDDEGDSFLGECGAVIGETRDGSHPKEVIAFEAWQFDKSDIRTVTKVFVSEETNKDTTLIAKLQVKGDVLVARKGETYEIETASLKTQIKILSVKYKKIHGVPDNTVFDEITFEFSVFKKPGAPTP